MRLSIGSKNHFVPESWLEMLHDYVVGALSGTIRSCYILGHWVYVNIVRPLAGLVGVHLPTGKKEKTPGAKIKVAAVGCSRTGTYSIMLALEELGFPTFHTIHMYSYENEDIMNMFTENIVRPAFEAGKPEILGKVDMKLIAESGYQAVADMPSSFFFEEILAEFPDCKFILTTRESSEVWFRSYDVLHKNTATLMYLGGFLFPTVRQYSNYMRWLNAYMNNDALALTSTFPKQTNIKENAIANYEEHNARVREVIPPEQLLEFSVTDGWGPLCSFLEIEECPDTPFPKTNSSRYMAAQSNSAFWTATLVLLYIIYRGRKALLSKKVTTQKPKKE